MDKIAIVGLGNISKRHRANLRLLYPYAKIFAISSSGRKSSKYKENIDEYIASIDDLVGFDIDMAIVASPAPFHMQQASQLLKINIPVLIEKPLADSLESFEAVSTILHENSYRVEVAYNLRFMPSAIELKKLLNKKTIGRIYSVSIDVGQYLPDWRSAVDYRDSVSAQKKLGGGVLLELSHEIDYLQWLFGSFDTVYCVAISTGMLDVDVEDNINAIFHRKKDSLVVNLHMDFLQRAPARTCKIIGEAGTLVWDLLDNSIYLHCEQNKRKALFSDPNYDRNQMYLEVIQHFSRVAKGELKPNVDVDQALCTLQLIDAMKKSSAARQVVNIGALS